MRFSLTALKKDNPKALKEIDEHEKLDLGAVKL